VPLWTTPIALGAGNCVILKPSEKVPMTMHRIVKLAVRAGFPPVRPPPSAALGPR